MTDRGRSIETPRGAPGAGNPSSRRGFGGRVAAMVAALCATVAAGMWYVGAVVDRGAPLPASAPPRATDTALVASYPTRWPAGSDSVLVTGEPASPPPAFTPPRQLTTADFEYPEALWDAQVEGEVIVRVLVSAAGGADSVRVEQTSGHAQFDSVAVQGARTLRFEPATSEGEPVAQWVFLPVRFEMDAYR